jgi:hypothetical protein
MSIETSDALMAIFGFRRKGITVMEWISVKDAMPDQFVDVLCFCDNGRSIMQKVMCINADDEWQSEDDFEPRGESVTHWMELPDEPKGE